MLCRLVRLAEESLRSLTWLVAVFWRTPMSKLEMDETQSYEYELSSSQFGSARWDPGPGVRPWRPEYSNYPKNQKSCAILVLEERLDIEFGLLDKLLSNGILSGVEYTDVKTSQPAISKSEKLLTYINEKKKNDEFDRALIETKQQHLLNYCQSSGKYNRSYGGDWPLTERQIEILNVHQEVLVELMELSPELVEKLYSMKVLNRRHKEFISDHSSNLRKSDIFIDILRRRSFRDYKETIVCFRFFNQKHIAEILEGGVVGRITCSLETHIPFAETRRLARKIAEMYSGKLSIRSLNDGGCDMEMKKIGLIDIRFDNEIVLYFHFKETYDFLHLKEMYDSCELRTTVESDFKKLHSNEDFAVTVQWPDDDFGKCKAYTQSRPFLARPTCVSDFPMEVLEIVLSKAYALYFYLVRPSPGDIKLFKSLSSVSQFWHETIARSRFKTAVNRCLSTYFHLITKRNTIIRNNRKYLVENMEPSDLLISRLREASCLSKAQAAFVNKLRYSYGKNHELLNIARRLCSKQHAAFIDCLHFCRQINVANVMEKGGVVVKTRVIHERAINIEELRKRLSEKIRRMRVEDTQKFQQTFRILSEIDIFEDPCWKKRKRSEGIVMLLWCKSEDSFQKLKKLADSSSLLELLSNIINCLLSNDQASDLRQFVQSRKPPKDIIRVKSLIIDAKQFQKRIAVRKMSLVHLGQINVLDPQALTSLDDKIYVLFERLITVHEDSLPFARKTTIPFKSRDLQPISSSALRPFMESCDRTKCIYFACFIDSCIWRLRTSKHEVEMWMSDIDQVFSLSVNCNGNVLILKNREQSNMEVFLKLYTKDAELLRQIQLPSENNLPPHSLLEVSPGVLAINYRNRIIVVQQQRLLNSEIMDANDVIQYPKTHNAFIGTVASYAVNRLVAVTADNSKTLIVLDLQLNEDAVETECSSMEKLHYLRNHHYRKDKRQLMALHKNIDVFTIQYHREDTFADDL